MVWGVKRVMKNCFSSSVVDIECEYEGTGYVYEQSIEKDTTLNVDDILKVKLKSKMKEKDKEDEEQDK